MKREICCDDCARGWLRTAGVKATPDGMVPEAKVFEIAQGEAIKQVRGALTKGALCDGCAKELPAATIAVAVSVYSRSLPYFEWEEEWIAPPAAAPAPTSAYTCEGCRNPQNGEVIVHGMADDGRSCVNAGGGN